MKSWRTTLGGSLESLGAGIRDLTTLASLGQVASGDELHRLNVYTIIVGMVITYIGKFFSNLFAADNSAVSSALEQHTQAIAELKRDTATIAKPDATLILPLAKPEPSTKVGP